ncbi:hydroxypyruvate isomerase family protein [Vogesella fluminis]|uniref:Hydroxypyruvate isomerase n=1 Tax=Vogesella fluminis TaxID=1069161 RepID=A0ABQ3HA16_9NEIS|nr:TIM barrel protein [Vogesella fluminis]GHD74617.1 hydroxypyruvate isomerase [Vogesella fluminis]
MPRFAANLSLLFTELPLPARFAAAAAAGFDAVEIQFPYDYPAPLLRTAADAAAVDIILINLPAGDLMAGGYGLASHPARTAPFRAALAEGERYAQLLGVRMVNVLAGRFDPQQDAAQTRQTLAANLALAGERLAMHGIHVTCEAINNLDMPGFVASTPAELAAVLAEAAHPNVSMQLDLYHLARMQLELAGTLAQYLPQTAHIQFADCPGRHEPGTGTLPLAQIFALLDELGYTGWCAAEYRPATSTVSSLHWLTARY